MLILSYYLFYLYSGFLDQNWQLKTISNSILLYAFILYLYCLYYYLLLQSYLYYYLSLQYSESFLIIFYLLHLFHNLVDFFYNLVDLFYYSDNFNLYYYVYFLTKLISHYINHSF